MDEISCVSRFFNGDNKMCTGSPEKISGTITERASKGKGSPEALSQTTIDSASDLRLPLHLEDYELHIEPFYNITPRHIPISPHNVLEEEFSSNPWALLVATIFLTKTAGKIARPYMKEFFKEYPTPYHVINERPQSLERFFENLGLIKRAHMIWKLSYQFVSSKWRRASDLCGVGKYGEDAYRIFCLGHTDLDPNDRYLKLYINWLSRCTEFLEENSIMDSESYVIEDPVIKYYAITIRDDKYI